MPVASARLSPPMRACKTFASEPQKGTRLVLEMSERVDFKVFSLDAPRRIVLDLPSLDWPDVNASPEPKGLISGLRFGQFTATQSRLVIDLNTPAIVSRSFVWIRRPAFRTGWSLI